MLFDIGLRAPYGNVFVMGLIAGGIGEFLLYALAIIAGAVAPGLLAGIVKKNKMRSN